jgi:hypothetical protein
MSETPHLASIWDKFLGLSFQERLQVMDADEAAWRQRNPEMAAVEDWLKSERDKTDE